MKNKFIILLLPLFIVSCGNKNEKAYELSADEEFVEAEVYVESDELPPPPPPPPSLKQHALPSNVGGPNVDVIKDRKIKRRAEIEIDELKDVDASKERVGHLLSSLNGFVVSEEFRSNRNFDEYDMELRVPADSLDKFVASLNGLEGKISKRNFYSEDLTAKYLDSKSRKETKQAMLENYRRLLSTAKDVEDLLEIQERIDEIQEDAEAMSKVIMKIDYDVEFSSVDLTLSSYRSSDYGEKEETFLSKVADAFKGGLDVIVGLIKLWPLYIIAGVIVYFVCKRKLKKAKKINE
ncbi:MAG: DUF4349 domain-containing protein [Paludibacteraceae bacterium]|nr:DUF4349 domain-containing protein [Paludibacteraceae bacterium]